MTSLESLVRYHGNPASEQGRERFRPIFGRDSEAENSDVTPDESAACGDPHLEDPSSGNKLGEGDVGDGNVIP